MDPRVAHVKREILASGTDDWVHAAEFAAFAREALYGDRVMDGFPEDDRLSVEALAAVRENWLAGQEREALPLAIEAIKELLREGLVRVGETVGGGFAPWTEPLPEVEARIDSVVEAATYPLLPGELFWVENTLSGHQMAESDLGREEPT